MIKLAFQLRHGVADLGILDAEIQSDDEDEVVESLIEIVRIFRLAVYQGRLSEPLPPDVVPGQ